MTRFIKLSKSKPNRKRSFRKCHAVACEPLVGREGNFVLKYFLLPRGGSRSKIAAQRAGYSTVGAAQI